MDARLASQDNSGRSAVVLTYLLGVAVGVMIAVVL